MKNKRVFLLLFSISFLALYSCKKNNGMSNIPGNGNLQLTGNGPQEDIFYSRDTTDKKAYQMHVKYNANGSVDILRNEVGGVHAFTACYYLAAGIQTIGGSNSIKAVLLNGMVYWLVPFAPGTAAISVPSSDTAVYSATCASSTGGPCLIVAQLNPAKPALITVNPRGCASNSLVISTHANTYTFGGGAVLLSASSLNIKK